MGLFDIFHRPKPKTEDRRSPAGKQEQEVTATPEEWHLGRTLLDDFVVERVLGEGGMGKVYLVKSRTTGMRFAVKRAKGLSERERRNFLAELQTWIDLPEHPNLVPCQFFRTVQDEILIFAEYVAGGSLKNWIDSRKLYEGGGEKTLERILDTAIQFAWGLHCVHELGLVHQDVKPANVMMDKDAKAAMQGLRVRVTDYGLARARAVAGERHEAEDGQSILVSSGGYTPAYCSPEQASGRKLDRRTDVWSWGVSVLEMFQGGVSWQSGRVGAQVLETFLEDNGKEEDIPAMPNDVAGLLAKCFREDPAQRWQSLEAVVQKLKGVYRTAVGVEYSRELSKIQHGAAPQAGAGERRTREGTSWRDPREWLERALRAEGRDPSEAAEIIARQPSSRRGQLVADVAAYHEARRMYERLVKSGRKDLANELATVCHWAAFVHETADDSSGALALYDKAIEIRERLINVEGRRELANDLATLYNEKANAVVRLGNNRAAVGLYDRAIEILERLVNAEGRIELAGDLAGSYMNKALSVQKLGDIRTALDLYEGASEILERLVNVKGRGELINNLASLYSNKASVLYMMGDARGAVALYDRAIDTRQRGLNWQLFNSHDLNLYDRNSPDSLLSEFTAAEVVKIRERLIKVDSQREFGNDMAKLYSGKAVALRSLGDNRAAGDLYDRAIEILERLVNVEGRRELAGDLAGLYMNKALSILELGDIRAALDLYDRASEILERLVNVEGRRELADSLAVVYMNKGIAVMNMGDNQAAVALYDRAIEIRERLVNVEGRRELAEDLASLYKNKAISLSKPNS